MKTLGIAIYPDKTTFAQDCAYLEKAKALGYTRVFTSFLQFNQERIDHCMRRFKESMQKANSLGFETIVDVHPYVFKFLNISYDDLSFFKEIGVQGLRLDVGFTGKEEAKMTHNPYGLHIEINMSNDTHYLSQILDYNPDKNHLLGSHNFYPQRFTGLSLPYFQACSAKFREANIRSACFISAPSAPIGPWPLQEGLVTLEDHRDKAIDVQVRHLNMLDCVDDVIIANVFASDEELKQASDAFHSRMDCIGVCFFDDTTNLEKEVVLNNTHNYRGDHSAYVIRSSRCRMKYREHPFPKQATAKPIHRGDILLLNESYGQYKGEVQIALVDREADDKINVIGYVKPDELMLMEQLKIYQEFTFHE